MKLFVSKNEDGHILMGEETVLFDVIKSNEIIIKNVVKFITMATERGMTIVPVYYPMAIVAGFIKKEFINDMVVTLNLDDYLIFDDNKLNTDLIDMYRKEIARRSGIDIITSMPNISNIRTVK